MKSQNRERLEEASRSPWHFLTHYVKTHDPMRGIVPFPEFAYLQELVETVTRERFLLVPKSRQMMVTWTMVAYFLWRCLFRGSGVYLFLSRNERCAAELLERVRLIMAVLPAYMRPKATTNSKEELAFGALNSRILSLPASPNGPRMYSPTGVLWDEMAFTPYDEHIWAALKPALDSGGSFVGVSSSGGPHNLFAKFCLESPPLLNLKSPPACGGAGGSSSPQISDLGGTQGGLFHIHRIHYSLHPNRTNENWKQQAMSGLSEARWNMEQEISFDTVLDLVYSEFDSVRHILPAPWHVNPCCDLYRSIDFGYHHPYVMWIQRVGDDAFVVFDEWAGSDATTEQMLNAIRKIDAKYGLSERDFRFTACDPAGAQVQDTGVSPADLLKRSGMKLAYRSSSILAGVEKIKAALQDAAHNTKLHVTSNCTQLISDFSRYKWSGAENEPLKDGLSDHSLDALRYFFVNLESVEDMAVMVRMAGTMR